MRNSFFEWRVVAVWAFSAFYQSLVFYNFSTTSGSTGQNSSGKMFGLWDVSTLAFTCVVVTVNLRLLMMCNLITRWHYASVGGSILAWFLFVFIYCLIRVSLLPALILKSTVSYWVAAAMLTVSTLSNIWCRKISYL